ncbi:GIY-YIG nuclease family protein [Flavobacterium sp. BFFFF1]|uniref:GIY-YIG nuclease family protein n=1 Tax=Flavobacterium sp. BFFFF1 TaxID=2015557 RepID=UPI00342F0FA1
MNFFTYILYCISKDKYYVGSTSNPERRLMRHNQNQRFYGQTRRSEDRLLRKIPD